MPYSQKPIYDSIFDRYERISTYGYRYPNLIIPTVLDAIWKVFRFCRKAILWPVLKGGAAVLLSLSTNNTSLWFKIRTAYALMQNKYVFIRRRTYRTPIRYLLRFWVNICNKVLDRASKLRNKWTFSFSGTIDNTIILYVYSFSITNSLMYFLLLNLDLDLMSRKCDGSYVFHVYDFR